MSRYHYDYRKLLGFLKKTGIIYVAAIAAYLPLNIYNGYFNQANLLLNMLKDLVFDGTLYHLWYLPASMLGMLIAWQVVQKLDYSKGLIVAGLLYLIGLFGDSYYGIAVKLPGVKSICDKTAYKLLRSGEIRSFVIGRHYCIPKLNILKYLELVDKSGA